TYKDRQRDSVLLFHDKSNENVDFKTGRLIIRPVHKFSYRIVKENQKIYFYDSLYGLGLEGKNVTYAYEEDSADLDWQLTTDTATVHGFLCQKATIEYGGRIWTAWFTPEIPISDGPYKFSGLPGLIIKINDTENLWNFELVKLEPTSKVITINFKEDKQPVLITKREFLANKKHYREIGRASCR